MAHRLMFAEANDRHNPEAGLGEVSPPPTTLVGSYLKVQTMVLLPLPSVRSVLMH